jgi:hypothetical protein
MASFAQRLIPGAATRAVLRNVLLVFIALDLVVLVAFSVRVSTTTRTTSAPAAVVPAETGAPAIPAPPVPVADAGVPLGGGGVPISQVDAPAAPSTAPSTPPHSPAVSQPTPTEEPAPAPPQVAKGKPCPIDIASSETGGGLQSLIDLVPAFGPYKAEAFAFAPAMQPVLQLIGPILERYPALATTLKPALDPLLGAFAKLLDAGFSLISPLYAPYRQQVLDAETKLAAALAPYAQQLANSELGGCIIAVQNALLGDIS